MLYLFIVALTSASFNILFKIFQRVGINSVQAIIINYIVAALVSFMLLPKGIISSNTILYEGWLYGGALLGILFYSSMYLYAITTKKFGIAITTLMTRMSLILPAIVSFLAFGEIISLAGWCAIAMILVAIYLMVIEPQKGITSGVVNKKAWHIAILPLLVFIFCGTNDTTIKFVQHNYIESDSENSALTFITYLSSLIVGLIAYLSRKGNRNQPIKLRSVIGGVIMGLINVVNVYSLLTALSFIDASVAFPTINIVIVVVSVIVGVVAFKERMSMRRWIGIAIAILAIYLIT